MAQLLNQFFAQKLCSGKVICAPRFKTKAWNIWVCVIFPKCLQRRVDSKNDISLFIHFHLNIVILNKHLKKIGTIFKKCLVFFFEKEQEVHIKVMIYSAVSFRHDFADSHFGHENPSGSSFISEKHICNKKLQIWWSHRYFILGMFTRTNYNNYWHTEDKSKRGT